MSSAIRAVIFDWAGTTVDYGSRAPVEAILQAFAAIDLPVTEAEARRDMGLAKLDHIRAVLGIPRVAAEYQRLFGVEPGDAVARTLYKRFLPIQESVIVERSQVIAGVPETIAWLKEQGVSIGTTTGYTSELLALIQPQAREQGLLSDIDLTPDVVGAGRPAPLMIYHAAVRLQAHPLWQCIKIGDTPSDIAEGRNAGMWTVGITRTGNEVGCSLPQWEALTPAKQAERVQHAGQRLQAAGAHYLAESVGECVPVLQEIEQRIRAGQRP